jgi:hypothetical protein
MVIFPQGGSNVFGSFCWIVLLDAFGSATVFWHDVFFFKAAAAVLLTCTY